MILIFGGITLILIYISSLTGFFSLYYYDKEKHKNIRLFGENKNTYKVALFTLRLYYIATIFMAFYIKIIIGILCFILLTIITIIINNYIKNNMEIISEIHCWASNPIITIKFTGKRYKLFLIPISNPIIILLYIVLIIIIIFIIMK